MKRIAFIILTALALSCGNSDTKTGGSEIIVSIGSESITKEDLQNDLNKLSFRQKSLYTSSPEKLNEYLQTKINEKVLYKEAVKRGIQDRKNIEDEVNNYREKLITKTLGKEILAELEIKDQEIKDYYDQHQEDYQRVDISKILIKVKPDNDDPNESALTLAESIMKRAQAGESFEELALEFTDDPLTKSKGGHAGFISRGWLPQDIESRVFELNEGDITKPFEVENGYLIIKVNKGTEIQPYNQVERNIRSKLINERLLTYINNLRKNWNVRVYEERLEEIINSETK